MYKEIQKWYYEKTADFKKNPLSFIFEWTTTLFMVSFLISMPLFTYNSYSFITTILGGIFAVLAFAWLLFFNRFTFERSVIAMALFVFFITVSALFNSFENVYRTIYVLPIIFIALYEFAIASKKTKIILNSFALSIILFSLIYIFHYWNELISLNFDRLGEDFATNINQVGSLFSYGIALFSYLCIVRKKLLYIIPTAVVVFLGISTGSKSFLLDSLICIVIEIFYFFGIKKWRLSLIMNLIGFAALFLALQLDVFSSIRVRLYDMIQYIFTGIPTSDPSTNERLMMAKEAFYLFLKKPFFGWGFKGVSIFGSYGTYSHNTFTEILANFGFLALIAFEYPVFEVLQTAYKRRKEHNADFGIPIVFVATMIFQQFTGVKFETKEYYVAMAIALAMLNEKPQTEKYVNFSLIKQKIEKLLSKKNKPIRIK